MKNVAIFTTILFPFFIEKLSKSVLHRENVAVGQGKNRELEKEVLYVDSDTACGLWYLLWTL